MIPALLQYFHSCYQADLRAIHLINLFSSKVSFVRMEHDPAWTSRTWYRHPVPVDWGSEAYRHLLIHGKERQLYACAFMLAGRAKVLGKMQEACAPLLLIPAQLTEDASGFMVEMDYSGMVVNPAFADVLQQGDEASGENLYHQLQEQLQVKSLDFETLQTIETAVSNLALPVALDDLYNFPLPLEISDLKARVAEQEKGFRLLPVLALGVTDKQSGSLGVLNELAAMAASTRFSPVIQALFTETPASKQPKGGKRVILPVALSANQEAILHTSAGATLSVVNGPPGTGKSFTIAAIAADRLSKGESVLIAAKNTQAVEVIADKIERDFKLPEVAVRATQKDYRGHLRKRLRHWLHGMGLRHVYQKELIERDVRVKILHRQITELTNELRISGEEEIRYGHLTGPNAGQGLWYKTRRWWLELRIGSRQPFWQRMAKLKSLFHEGHQEGRNYLAALFYRRLLDALARDRKHLQRFWEALKTRSGNEKEAQMQDVKFSRVLHALPVWLVNSAHIHQVLPLEEGLFDLVIIDEASQSDIASALPLLQRAKRAVIVGDPKQLRHVSFLSHAQQERFARQFGLEDFSPKAHLSFRDTSILDLAFDRVSSQEQVHMLDEHFRSQPDIIAFSNRRFYNNTLKIMTATPQNTGAPSVFIHRIEQGKRSASGQNTAEAEAIIQALSAIMEAEAGLDARLCQSIGLLSPFRGQVDLLKRRCEALFSTEMIERHRLLIGSPFDFQGEERDLMFLSWSVDSASPPGVYLYLNREDVFNVSVTRARMEQHLYLSVDEARMPAQSLLKDYLASCTQQPARQPFNAHAADEFMREVLDFLHEKGFDHYLIRHLIAGIEIDLVVLKEDQSYCIDFIGYPGPYEKPLPVERWKILGRLGLPLFALPYSRWLRQRADCEQALLTFLEV
jgi:hypothetical protein